jgi:hypothetical protein
MPPETRTCPVCWAGFTATDPRRVYCSKKCCGAAWERRGGRRAAQPRPAGPAATPATPARPEPAATRDCPHCGQPITIVALLTTPQAAQPRLPPARHQHTPRYAWPDQL